MKPEDAGRRSGGAPLGATAQRILEVFADAYPKSAHYRGGRSLRKGDWAEHLPQIASDVDALEDFLAAVDELVARGVVRVKWRRHREGSEVNALYLEDAERAFALLGRESPEAVRIGVLAALEEHRWREGDSLVRAVRDHLVARLEAHHPVELADESEARDLAVVLGLGRAEARSNPIRALSVRLFADSKRLERLLPTADRLVRAVTGESFSETHGLARSYPEVSIAVRGTLVMADDERRAWRCRGEVVTLPAATVEVVRAIGLDPGSGEAAVLSVENKETFHTLAARLFEGDLSPSFTAIVYGGGHPHRALIGMLARCREAGAELYHFGDLDPDGLFILDEIAQAVGCPIRPYLMDVETFRRYERFGYRLKAGRVEALRAAADRMPADVRELSGVIAAEGIGVEQEVVEVPGLESL